MSSVVVIVPVLARPHRIQPLMMNVRATTTVPHRLLFVVGEDDLDELAELRRREADFLVVPAKRRSWACKINDGFRASTERWVFTGADDLRFHPEWYQRAIRWAEEETCVIGTNDICNHRVMSGQHSTHTLFRRSYVEEFGTIDEPGLVMHEGYKHDFCDDEAILTAKARGVYTHAYDAIVEHLHPLNGKAEDDATYREGRTHSSEGRRLFQKRRVLWADEDAVRLRMIPAPSRAVVVTATYGDYDANLHVPEQQDVPCDFVCFTDNPDLEVPAPWKVVVREGMFPDNPRLSAKVPKMTPEVDCEDVVWIDASHEITNPSFVRQALASRKDGIAVFRHPRRDCAFQELDALLGSENQGGLYFSRPLHEQRKAYEAEGHPTRAGLFACGVVAWDLRNDRARQLGRAWLDETARWSHQDQVELPVVARRLGVKPGTFPIDQIDKKASRGRRFFVNDWLRIHPHIIKPKPIPVSVLLPFSSEDDSRIRAFEFVRAHYEDKGWEVVVGTCEGPWSKGGALADAFSRASHDILVIADADCICESKALDQAVQRVSEGAAWAVPHRRVTRLNHPATESVLKGGPFRQQGHQQQAVIGGGIVVCSREAWEMTGIDPRFLGWGGEDISLAWALETLCGPPARGLGRLYHLWHPPHQPRRGTPESEALAGRYRRAHKDPDAMRELIAEARLVTR